MQINVKKIEIKDNPLNRVTSEKLFKPRKIMNEDGSYRFHDDGIFSEKIFGRIGICKCKETTKVGEWCPKCGARVISEAKMPDYYFDCKIRVPRITNTKSFYINEFGKTNYDKIQGLFEYRLFVYLKESPFDENGYYTEDFINKTIDYSIIELDPENDDISVYNNDQILIGKEAIVYIGISEKFYNENTIKNIPIPHIKYRPIIKLANGSYEIGDLNKALISLIKSTNNIISFTKYINDDKIGILLESRVITEKYFEFMDKVFEYIKTGKKCIIKREVIGQSITSAIRAVVTNDDSLDEDTCLIGYSHIETLYPLFYKEGLNEIKDYCDQRAMEIEDLSEDVFWSLMVSFVNDKINANDYKILINRAPTIAEKSIVASRPVFTADRRKKYIMAVNLIMSDGMAMDTDGDVLLDASLFTREANEEAELKLPSKNYIEGAHGEVRNKLFEDVVYTAKNIYENDPTTRDKIKSIIYGE